MLRHFQLLLLVVVVASAGGRLAEASPSGAVDTAVSAKVQKLEKMLVSSRGAGFVRLTSADAQYFFAPPHNYSLVLVATALEKGAVDCAPCRAFHSSFVQAAQAYRDQWKGAVGGRPLYFGLLDFTKDGRDFFAKFQQDSAPVTYLFAPNMASEPRAGDRLPAFSTYSMQSLELDEFLEWIWETTSVKITIAKPFDYRKLAVNIGLLVVMALMAKFAYSRLYGLLTSPILWAIGALLFIINMDSGYMWNQIRKAPYSGMRDGRMEWIAPGFMNQFQVESQIMSILYSLLAACVIILVQRAPAIQDPLKQRVAIYVSLVAFFMLYSLLVNIFRVKNGGYPFRLLL